MPGILATAGLAGILIVLAALVWVKLNRKKPRVLRGYRRRTPSPPITKGRPDCTRDAFRSAKLPADVDYVVIGSGVGGLFCAGVLARAGYTVVVLEQHYVAGGCTHEFEDKGYSFDTGVHYVGNMNKYGPLLEMVSHPDHKVKWARTGTAEDGYVYDNIQLMDEPAFPFQAGVDNFIKNLVQKFPEEEAAIRQYVKLVASVSHDSEVHLIGKTWHPTIAKFVTKFATNAFQKYGLRTVQSVLDELTSNMHLKAILCGQFGDYGQSPHEASFFIHAGVAYHYMRHGGYYPVGGPQMVSRAIIPFIESRGGRVFVRASVTSVIVDDSGTARGVVMADGSKVMAKRGVISNAGALNTFTKLVPQPHRHRVNVKVTKSNGEVNDLKPGMSHLYFFIGLKGSSKELQLPSSNLWWLPVGPDYDLDAMRKRVLEDPFNAPDLLMFVGFPSAKDPTFHERFPNKSTCVVISEIEPRWFDAWRGYASGKRPADYKAVKQRFKDRIMARLLKLYPQLEGKVDYFDIATPLSNEFYLGRPDSYGMETTPQRFRIEQGGARCETGIKNLWLAGQDMCTPGYVGAMVGGGFAAGAVLGYTALDALALDRTVFGDLVTTAKQEAAAAAKTK